MLAILRGSRTLSRKKDPDYFSKVFDRKPKSAKLEGKERIKMNISKLEKISEGHYRVHSAVCPECETSEAIEVSSKWVFDANQGGRVSELLPFPQYSMELRERFISGLCAKDWNKVMMGVMN